MDRTNHKIMGTLATAIVAAALVPAAAVASSEGGGTYGQHLPPPAQELRGGGAYGQHLPAATQQEAPSPSTSSDDSSSGLSWGDGGAIVGGMLALIGISAVVVFSRRRGASRKSGTPVVSS